MEIIDTGCMDLSSKSWKLLLLHLLDSNSSAEYVWDTTAHSSHEAIPFDVVLSCQWAEPMSKTHGIDPT